MKVGGPAAMAASGTTSGARRAPADGFTPSAVGEASAPAPAARAGAMGAVSSLEALLALQETLGPLERRRRAVRRAGGLLDALDDLKLALLEPGGADPAALGRLADAARQARDATDEPALEGLLDEIELRAAVELAKRQPGEAMV